MKKKLEERVREIRFHVYDGISCRDLTEKLSGIEPTDILYIFRDEDYAEIDVYREREETDEEYASRKAEAARVKDIQERAGRHLRYTEYLKSKEEFVEVERVQRFLQNAYGIDRSVIHLMNNWGITGKESVEDIKRIVIQLKEEQNT